MKRLQPVVWTKGTFLSPQHLQIQDRFLENVLHFQLETLSFRPWGFRSLQIDAEGALRRLCSISRPPPAFCPTGCCSISPTPTARPRPRSLKDCFDPDQRTLDIYFAVPHYRDRGLNVANSAAPERRRRYTAEYETFRDENTGLSEKHVQVARKNFRFLTEGESLDGYSIVARGARRAQPRRKSSSSTRTSCRRCSISAPTIIWRPSRGVWWKF